MREDGAYSAQVHNLVPRCRSEFLLGSGFVSSLSVARHPRTRTIKGSEPSGRLQTHVSQHWVTKQHLRLGQYELVPLPSPAMFLK